MSQPMRHSRKPNHAQNPPCRKPATSAAHLDQLQQQAAHEPIRVKPNPHLYAQFAFIRLACRHHPALGALLTLNPHGKSVVGPLHDSLVFSGEHGIVSQAGCGTEGRGAKAKRTSLDHRSYGRSNSTAARREYKIGRVFLVSRAWRIEMRAQQYIVVQLCLTTILCFSCFCVRAKSFLCTRVLTTNYLIGNTDDNGIDNKVQE